MRTGTPEWLVSGILPPAADPIAAVQDANNFGDFDEVVISTLPLHASKWLKLDLPSKAERATGLPVTHIETKQHD